MDITINFILKFKHFHWITPNYLFFKLKNYYYDQALDLINYSIHLFVIKSKYRDELKSFLIENGIECGIHYPISITETDAFSNLNLGEATRCIENSKQIISLPMYPELEDEQISYISDKIHLFYKRKEIYRFESIITENKVGTLNYINEYDFDEYINEKNFVVSLFTSHWCGPCQTQEMTLCSIMQKHDNEDIQFIKIDTDNSVDLVNSLSIRSIPTTIIFKNGKIVSEIIGAVSSDVVVQHLAHINNDENFQ